MNTISNTFDKPFKTYKQQIELLEDRGLIINDETFALDLLETIGYYPLINGFSNPFITVDENGNEEFKPDTYIENIYFQYVIDNNIQDFIFPEITKIENHLKSVLGYVVSDNMGVNDKYRNEDGNINDNIISYLDISRYQYDGKTKNVLREIKKTSIKSKNNPTAYYREEKNHIPPWILFRNIYLWQANSLYKGLPPKLKEYVCSKFIINSNEATVELKSKIFSDSFEILREFRNCVAHGSRIYAFKSKATLNLKGIETFFGPGIISKSEFNKKIGKNDLYSLFLCILLLTPSSIDRAFFISKIENFTMQHINLDLDNNWSNFPVFMSEANLPNDFVERLKKANDYLELIK